MKNLDLSSILLVSYLARLLILGASIGDAVALTALVSLFGFTQYLKYKKEPEVNAIFRQDVEILRKELADVKQTVQAFKLGTSHMRNLVK